MDLKEVSYLHELSTVAKCMGSPPSAVNTCTLKLAEGNSCVYIIVIEPPMAINIATVIKRSLCCNKAWDKVQHHSIKTACTLAFGLK